MSTLRALFATACIVALSANYALKAADPPLTLRRVWAGDDVPANNWAVSPNGKWIAHGNARSQVMLHDVASGQDRALTDPDSADVYNLAWSRNSSLIAYFWQSAESSEIHVVDVSGGMPRKVIAEPRVAKSYVEYTPLGWSADGKTLIAMVSRDNSNDLVTIAVQNGESRILKSIAQKRGDRFPASILCPDGRYIAFGRSSNGANRDIFVLNIATGQETTLITHVADDYPVAWSPDAGRVFFASNRTTTMDLWAIGVKEGLPVGLPERIRPDVGLPFSVGITQDGALFFHTTRRNFLTEVYTADWDSKVGTITGPLVAADERYSGYISGPDWSPNGDRLIAQIGTPPGDPDGVDLVFLSVPGQEERKLHTQLKMFSRPRFAPDGRTVVVQGRTMGNVWGIYEVDLEDGTAKLLVPQPTPNLSHAVVNPAWSMDGSRLFFEHLNDSVLILNRQTGQTSEIYKSNGASGLPTNNLNSAPSPDGRRVAVVDGSSLYVVSAEGGAPRRILDLKEPSQIRFSSLAWTPDARWLLFGKWNGDRGELWRISPDGGTAQFAGLLARDEYPYFLRVSPDGLKLAFSLGDGALPTSEIWVMENFLAAK